MDARELFLIPTCNIGGSLSFTKVSNSTATMLFWVSLYRPRVLPSDLIFVESGRESTTTYIAFYDIVTTTVSEKRS